MLFAAVPFDRPLRRSVTQQTAAIQQKERQDFCLAKPLGAFRQTALLCAVLFMWHGRLFFDNSTWQSDLLNGALLAEAYIRSEARLVEGNRFTDFSESTTFISIPQTITSSLTHYVERQDHLLDQLAGCAIPPPGVSCSVAGKRFYSY